MKWIRHHWKTWRLRWQIYRLEQEQLSIYPGNGISMKSYNLVIDTYNRMINAKEQELYEHLNPKPKPTT